MCPPVIAAAAAIAPYLATAAPYVAAATAAYGVYATNQSANAQERAMRKQQKVQDEQLQAQASVDANSRVQQAREERSRLRAASAESGVAGVSIADLLDNVDMQAGTDVALIGQNLNNRREGSRTELGSRLSSITQPDYVGETLNAGLQIYRNRTAVERARNPYDNHPDSP